MAGVLPALPDFSKIGTAALALPTDIMTLESKQLTDKINTINVRAKAAGLPALPAPPAAGASSFQGLPALPALPVIKALDFPGYGNPNVTEEVRPMGTAAGETHEVKSTSYLEV